MSSRRGRVTKEEYQGIDPLINVPDVPDLLKNPLEKQDGNLITDPHNSLKIGLPVPYNTQLMQWVCELKPFEQDDPVNARIYWDFITDKARRHGLLDDVPHWDAEMVEKYLLSVFYWLSQQNRTSYDQIHQLVLKPIVPPDEITLPVTAADLEAHSLQLCELIRLWENKEFRDEYEKLLPKPAIGDDKQKEDNTRIAKANLSSRRAEVLKTIGIGPPETPEDLNPEFNKVKLSQLWMRNRSLEEGIPKWIKYLYANHDIATIGDLGGWGISRDPRVFHRRIVTILNQNPVFRDDLEVKVSVGRIRYDDVEKFITDQGRVLKIQEIRSILDSRSRKNGGTKRP